MGCMTSKEDGAGGGGEMTAMQQRQST